MRNHTIIAFNLNKRASESVDPKAATEQKSRLTKEVDSVQETQSFVRVVKHRWICIQKCLGGIDSIKLSTFDTIPGLMKSYKQWSSFYADFLAHGKDALSRRPTVPKLFGKTGHMLIMKMIRDVRRWGWSESGSQKAATIRTYRLVTSLLQFKRAFPVLPHSFVIEAEEKHREALGSTIQPFKNYDIVADIIEKWFPMNWANKKVTLNSLKNGSIYEGGTARNLGNKTKEVDNTQYQRGSGSILASRKAKDVFDRLYVQALQEGQSPVKAVGVPDAAKIRMITKGKQYLKTLQPLQQALSKQLGSYKEFSLTRKPMELLDMIDLKNRSQHRAGQWVSIDYSSATDCVDGSFAAELISQIIDRSGSLELQSLKEIAVQECSLGRQVEYKDGKAITQTRGTLMGSLLSFPILCCWNGSIISRALGHRDFFVNGDDGLAKMTKTQFKTWANLSDELGLTPTPGKSYFSNGLITFCSVYYYIDGSDELHYVQHLNAKHMTQEANGKIYNELPSYAKEHYKQWCLFRKGDRQPLFGPDFYGGKGAIPDKITGKDLRCLIAANKSMKGLPFHVSRLHPKVSSGQVSIDATWFNPSNGFAEKEIIPLHHMIKTKSSVKFSSLKMKELWQKRKIVQ